VFTSCFARVKLLPPELSPVSIAVGTPRWFRGPQEPALMPTRAMLQMDTPTYARLFEEILRKADARAIADKWGPDAVFLCWERPGAACHRRAVAEFLETQLGIDVPEWGAASGRWVVPPFPRVRRSA
jgi:hypothetical protein